MGVARGSTRKYADDNAIYPQALGKLLAGLDASIVSKQEPLFSAINGHGAGDWQSATEGRAPRSTSTSST